MMYVNLWIPGIEMFHQLLDRAEAGDQLGALVRGLKRQDLKRGHIVAKPNTINMHNHFKAQCYLLTKEEGGRPKPFTKYFQAQMYCKTWDVPAFMSLPEGKDLIMPGEDTSVIFTLRKSMVLEKGMRFTMRDGKSTLGYGVITDLMDEVNIEEVEKQRKTERKAEEKEAESAAAY